MTNSPDKAVPVNGARLRATRLRQRMGTRDIARAGGTTFTVIDLIEKTNTIGSQVTLAEARKIAAAAGLSLLDLLTIQTPIRDARMLHDPDEVDCLPPRTTSADSRDCHEESATTQSSDTVVDDCRLLAQVLSADTRSTEVRDLCLALGWTLPRLRAAQAELNEAAAAIGLRVHENPFGLCLRPTEPDVHAITDLLQQRRTAATSMTAGQAALVRQAATGVLPDETRDADKPHLGYLINIGVLRPGERGESMHVLTDEARDAFNVPNSTPQAEPILRKAPRRSNTSGLLHSRLAPDAD